MVDFTTRVSSIPNNFAKNVFIMKKIFIGILLILSAFLFASCEKEGNGSKAKVTFRKANIAGSNMLALAQGTGTATKAEGDISIGSDGNAGMVVTTMVRLN